MALSLVCIWAYASEYPSEVQALLDRESAGIQLTPAEKRIVSDYFNENPTISPWIDTQWGPDGYYIAKDELSGGQTYNWIDISATGTELWPGQDQDDTWSAAIDLPFTFPYYGTTRDSLKISANVLLSFENQTAPSYSLAIPSAAGQMKIDPWCYDMYHHGTDTVEASHYYYQAFGDSLFVVQFKQARYYNSTYRYDETYGKDLEVLLYSDGRVVFQYNTLRNILAGSPFTSGLEDSVGTAGLSCGNSFSNGYAVTFYRLSGVVLANGTVTPATGNASTNFAYSCLYRNTNNIAPTTAMVYIDNVPYTLTDPTGGAGPYTNGVTFTYNTTLTTGTHEYYYVYNTGGMDYRYPETGSMTGPTVYSALSGSYDIGGGFNDFPNLVSAVSALTGAGMSGPVTFNVYSGTYDGQVIIPNTISGLSSENPLVFQAAPGQTPVCINSTGTTLATGSVFRLTGADYVTIRGFEITSTYAVGVDLYYAGTSPNYDSTKYAVVENCYIHDFAPSYSGYGIYGYYTKYCTIRNNKIQGDYYGINISYGQYNDIYNNFVYNNDYYGVRLYAGGYNNFYHNTVYMNTNYGTTNYALYLYNATGTNIVDNIIINDGSGSTTKYAYYISGTLATYPVNSNYNCIYAPNSSLGYYTAARANLAAWQTATALDANSISLDPMFVNTTTLPFDLHIITNIASPVNNAGTPVAMVTTDFDGDMRDLTTPDIGADEFTPVLANYNVMVLPPTQSSSVFQGGVAWYYYYVKNVGGAIDTYNLSTIATWSTLLYDSAGMFPITSIGPVAPDDSAWVLVGHLVPSGIPVGSSDTGSLIAQSVNSVTVSDTAQFTTYVPFSGSYDIGGGNNDFATPVQAVNLLMTVGMGNPVTFNVYPGVYDGQILVNNTLSGLSAANPLIFQGVPGLAAPQIINTTGTTSTNGNGFSIVAADYVTIRGFEIYNCYYSGIDIYYSGTDSSCYLTIENNYIHDIGATASNYGMYVYRTKYSEIRNNIVQGDYYGIYAGYCMGLKLYNNMVYGQDYYGLRIYYGSDIEMYHNSVYMNSTYGTTNYAAYIYYVTNATFKNNIVYNEGSGSTTKYAIYIGGTLSTYPVVSDYNCFYAPNSSLGYYTAARATLADWQTATMLDANSISADPMYLSTVAPFNFHINTAVPSPVDNIGTPIGIVGFDIDGDARNMTAPDLGADEFTYNPPVQYGVSITPESYSTTGLPGAVVQYPFYIFNTGNVADTYALTLTNNTWNAEIKDAAGLVITTTPQIVPGDSFYANVFHYIPMGAPADSSDNITFTAASPTTSDFSVITTTVFIPSSYGVVVMPETQTGNGIPGDVVNYDYYVFNSGNVSDSYYLTSTNNTWPVSIYDLSTMAPISMTNALAPGDSQGVRIAHFVPTGVPGDSTDMGYLYVESSSDSTVFDNGEFTTTAGYWPPVQVDIVLDSTNIVIPAGGGMFGFNLTVTNHSTTEGYSIQIWKAVDLPNGTTINLFSIGLTIPPGMTIERHVNQMVPAGAPAGTYTYHICLAEWTTWTLWDDDSFTFVKEAGDAVSNGKYTSWAISGWFDDGLISQFVIPSEYNLRPCYPNPFNPETNIVFDMPESGEVFLAVYDIRGREVAVLADGFVSYGQHHVRFSGNNLPSGIYFAVFRTNDFSKTQKLLLVK